MDQAATSTRRAGDEPVPGYRLIEPLGQGGFGEVWKCEVPGGLYKAIKFVREGPTGAASQERSALVRMKMLRHPFLLSLERVEDVDGVLVIVMELADRSLHALHSIYRDRGEPGLPRDELLSYLGEAAEALDWLNFEHGLQHLDVKPHNLFLVCNHIKVADFGLVHQLGDESDGQSTARKGGVTPLYSAPELLRGTISRHSDQYSLAVVYQQLLTGTVPFWHENVYELMMQHLTGDPDLAALSDEDAAIVGRALAKVPEQRYSSCQEFVRSLNGSRCPTLRRSGAWRKMLTGGSDLRLQMKVPPSSTTPVPSPTAPLTQAQPQPAPPDRGHETPTRRIRTLSPAQLAASEIGREGLRAPATPPSPPPPKPRPVQAVAPSQGVEKTLIHPPPPPEPAPAPPAPIAERMLPAPTAVTLPGYRFVSCVNQSQLGDLWRAEDEMGQPRRALCLLGFLRYDTRLINHLQALRDPSLLATEVHWSPAERLVILSPWYEGTLRDVFEQRQAEGQSGVARPELLKLLRTAAEALDGLYARHGLQHLGIHPRNLLVDGDRLWLADFGLVPLVWLPTGQSAGALNGKYAAPELFDRRPSRSADQYSLGLIYAEMLTGVHPRPQRPGSGHHRRLPTQGPSRSGTLMRATKLDLDLLPAHDREIVAKALSPDPANRFGSCVEFLAALEAAGVTREEPLDRYHELLPVIPFSILKGDPVNSDIFLPPVAKLVVDLTRPREKSGDSKRVVLPKNVRYVVLPDGSWEYRCPLQIIPGSMPLKVEGFRCHWNARVVEESAELYRLQIDVPVPRSFWERVTNKPRRIEVEITVEPGPTVTRLTEARVRVIYQAEKEQQDRVLATMAPQVFDSVRVYLQAATEQRGLQRFPLVDEVHVYPVLPDLELGTTLIGTCKDISFGGISFRVPEKPATEYLYLHLCKRWEALGFALLARTVRARETDGGWEIGASFPVAAL